MLSPTAESAWHQRARRIFSLSCGGNWSFEDDSRFAPARDHVRAVLRSKEGLALLDLKFVAISYRCDAKRARLNSYGKDIADLESYINDFNAVDGRLQGLLRQAKLANDSALVAKIEKEQRRIAEAIKLTESAIEVLRQNLAWADKYQLWPHSSASTP